MGCVLANSYLGWPWKLLASHLMKTISRWLALTRIPLSQKHLSSYLWKPLLIVVRPGTHPVAVLLILVWSGIHTHAYIGFVYKFCGCLVDSSMACYEHMLTHCDMAWYKHTPTKQLCLQVVWVYVIDWAWHGTHTFPQHTLALVYGIMWFIVLWPAIQHTCTLAIVWYSIHIVIHTNVRA